MSFITIKLRYIVVDKSEQKEESKERKKSARLYILFSHTIS
jgi:hypothetical protein